MSEQVNRYYLTDIYAVPILCTFQIFIQITELISAHLQGKINVIAQPAACGEVF